MSVSLEIRPVDDLDVQDALEDPFKMELLLSGPMGYDVEGWIEEYEDEHDPLTDEQKRLAAEWKPRTDLQSENVEYFRGLGYILSCAADGDKVFPACFLTKGGRELADIGWDVARFFSSSEVREIADFLEATSFETLWAATDKNVLCKDVLGIESVEYTEEPDPEFEYGYEELVDAMTFFAKHHLGVYVALI